MKQRTQTWSVHHLRLALADKLKQTWRRYILRGLRYSNSYRKINTLYLVGDPWCMSSPTETHRFEETNRLILDNFGRVGSILEIGCGEGHQSLYLSQVCDRIVGLDVSARAVARARSRCPEGKFLVGDIFSKEVDALAPFDLVVACEVLYYMADVRLALRRIRLLSHNNLVTYFDGELANLDHHILSLPGTDSELFEFKDSRWRAAWQRGEQPKVKGSGDERAHPK